MTTTPYPTDAVLAPVLAATAAPEVFGIDSPERLAWFGRKRAGILAQAALVRRQAEEITRQLERELQQLDERYMAEAEAFVRQQLAGGKSKTLRTLGGSWSLRTVPGGIRKRDGQALLDWARDHAPELVRTTTTQDVTADAVKEWVYQQAAQAGGEVVLPPGVELTADRETFSHKTEA